MKLVPAATLAAVLVALAAPRAAALGADTGGLSLVVPDCPDDASPAPGKQIAVSLEMTLDGAAMGYAAFVDYDTGTLLYRPDLSSYTAAPFPEHIGSTAQADDGRLELDGSVSPGALGTQADAVLATLVFDVLAECETRVPVSFEVGGLFPSELSHEGVPVATTLADPEPFTLDDTPPGLIGCPSDIVVPSAPAGCAGAVVTYTPPTANDACDATPVIACTPPSGSTFPVGTTLVACTATDDCGNSAVCTFDVTVSPINTIHVTAELVGVNTPVTRCIRFVTSSCASFTDVPLAFVDHDFDGGASTPVRASADIEVPCGVFSSLCAKDRQHTRWTTVGLRLLGPDYQTTSVISLHGGDTDEDGDVDINDVTWFLGQFGDLAASGGCPFDGTRDSDFSNNGAVASEDYSFLVDGWLSTSGCACAATWGGNGIAGGAAPAAQLVVTTPEHAAADFNRDGRVDVVDVEIFEAEHGLPGDLSRAMRAARR